MLRPQPLPPIPAETARIARAAFRKGHPYLRLADELGALLSDETFAALFPSHGQPAMTPWRLACVTLLQFAEGLADRQAADAVRGRIDWKYLLRLELADAGFDASVLSEFRTRLVAGEAERLLLETLLTWCRERQLLKTRGRPRTDATQVLAAVRALNRVELVGETLRHALNGLAVAAPAWLAAHSRPEWADRYARRADDDRLPTKPEERQALAEATGRDGAALLATVHDSTAPTWLRELPAVETLRRVWIQQYVTAGGALRWRVSMSSPRRPLQQCPVRPGRPLRQEAHPGTLWAVGGRQGPPHRDLRRRRTAPDHGCADDSGDDARPARHRDDSGGPRRGGPPAGGAPGRRGLRGCGQSGE